MKPILVTGCSSGIGRHAAETLASRDHPVYATARNDEDLAQLEAIENVTAIRLDVRHPESVREAAESVRAAGQGLYGLVQNAGVGSLGFAHTFDDDDMRHLFETNVFGPLRLTSALLPLLLESKGRIVYVGSQGGLITGKFYGPYCMTKFALEALASAQRQELAPHGVHVGIVEPGGIVSEIGAKNATDTRRHFERAEPPFAEEARAVLAAVEAEHEPDPGQRESATNRFPSQPDIVTDAITHALFDAQPRESYLVGTKWEGDRVVHALLDRLLDANESPRHRYSREELVALLDEHLASRSSSPSTW